MRVGRPDITFEEQLPDEPIFADFDRRLVSQALTNVLKNATEGIDALGEHHAPGVIITTLSVDGGDLAEIAVSDTGKGFPREDRHRLIEPYVTTRAEGTGLGLPIVVKIFEDHGGGVELLDGPARLDGGRGAKVLMKLPLHRAETDTNTGGEREDRFILMAADILIVDDEDDIRGLVAGILEDEGHGARLARELG